MVRKMLTIVVLAFIGLVGTGGLATAAPYPPPPQNSISITITVVNGVVTVVGTGFFAGEPITITITYELPSGLRSSESLSEAGVKAVESTVADSAGNFSTPVVFTQAGPATGTATGTISGATATYYWAGTSAGTGSGSGSGYSTGSTTTTSLASTGTSIAGPIAIGAAALLAGLALLFFGTRGVIRRKSTGASS